MTDCEYLQITNGTNRTGVRYSYYSCAKHRRGELRCIFKPVRADLFDDWMLNQILAKILTPEAIRATVAEIQAKGREWLHERDLARTRLVGQLRDVERARDKLFERLEMGGKDTPDLSSISKRLQARNDELEQLQHQLERVESAPGPEKVGKIDPEIAIEVMRGTIEAGTPKKSAP